MAGLTGRGVLPLLKLPNAGILATQSYSTEVGIPYVLGELKYFSVLQIRDDYPVSRILIIIHPCSRTNNCKKRAGDKILLSHLFFAATNITELKIILFLNR
jgi:hypothetical protein